MASIIELQQQWSRLQKNSKANSYFNKLRKDFIDVCENEQQKQKQKSANLFIDSEKQGTFTTITINYPTYCPQVKGVSQFGVSFDQNLIIAKTYLLSCQRFISVRTKKLFLIFLPILMNLNKRLVEGVIQVNQENGFLIMKEISKHMNICNKKTATVVGFINRKIMSQRKIIIKYIQYFLSLIGEITCGKEDKVREERQCEILRNMNLSNVNFVLNNSDSVSSIRKEDEIRSKLLQERKKLRNVFMFEENQVRLYSKDSNDEAKDELFRSKHILEDIQFDLFKKYLIIPVAKVREEADNKYIFNYVKINNQKIQNPKKTFQGGTSEIYVTHVEIKYINYEEVSSLEDNKYNLKKLVAFKKNIKTVKNSHLSLERQVQIVQTLQDSASGFFIKYYQSKDPKCKLKDVLLMDYYPSYISLYKYIELHKKTLSFRIKLHILSNIANGIRFLSQKKIAHMDLTPSNIIISSHDMLPKIIDFGEAYHSQLKKDYYPGFTNPFGPPEVFSKKHYNTKQDMFSYGMNMFFMLFGNFPFQPTSLLKLSYKNNKYLQKFFFAPQCLNYYGNERDMNLVFQLISRCFGDQELRPQPSWCVILLKLITKNFIKQFC